MYHLSFIAVPVSGLFAPAPFGSIVAREAANEIPSRSQARKTRIAGVGTRDFRRVSQ